MPITKRLRFEVLRRDNHTCRYCGRSAPEVELTIDHVVPVALGGKDEPGNLVTACRECNSGKSSIPADAPLVEQVSEDAVRWAKAMQEAAYWRSIDRAVVKEVIAAVDREWSTWTFGAAKLPVERPTSWPDTIERLCEAGLDTETMLHFIGKAMRNGRVPPADTWSYFCGCCWRELEDLQDTAGRIVRREGER